MEENKALYNVAVPFNNPVMVAARKKQKKYYAILLFICSAIFGFFAIMAATSSQPSVAAAIIFGLSAGGCIGYGVYCIMSGKVNSKNDGNSVEYAFYNDYLQIIQKDANKNKNKTLSTCLYRSFQNKQYVATIVEDNEKFEFKIYIGTYNMMPQYKKYVVPKDVLKESLESFTEFFKQKLGTDYVIKQK